MVAAVVEERSPEQDPVTGWLRDVLAGVTAEFDTCRAGDTADSAALIDQIALAEQIGHALAGFKAAKMVRFREAQIAAQHADGWDPVKVGGGIADQLGLACHISAYQASRRLNRAWALCHELPATLDLMAQGRLSEWAAGQVVTETWHLDSTTRQAVDRELVDEDRIDTLGVRAVAAAARGRAYRADPHGYTERGKTERKHRRVSIRPAPDTMSWLSGYLPVEQGVACYAALHRATDTAKAFGDPRSRNQIMADTLVERLTGQTRADTVPLDIHLTDQPDTDPPGDGGEPGSRAAGSRAAGSRGAGEPGGGEPGGGEPGGGSSPRDGGSDPGNGGSPRDGGSPADGGSPGADTGNLDCDDAGGSDPHPGPTSLTSPAPARPDTRPEPAASEPVTPEPATPEPGLTETGLTEPGLTEPGLTEPATPEPGTPELGPTEAATVVLPDAVAKWLGDHATGPGAVHLLVPWITLHGGDRPGLLVGHGPIPAPLVRQLITTAAGHTYTSRPPRPP